MTPDDATKTPKKNQSTDGERKWSRTSRTLPGGGLSEKGRDQFGMAVRCALGMVCRVWAGT